MPPTMSGPLAGVAELADALDSKSSARKGVSVQVRPPVLLTPLGFAAFFCAPILTTNLGNTPKTLHGQLSNFRRGQRPSHRSLSPVADLMQ